MRIRVLIADSRSDRREMLRAALTADPEIEIAGQARDGQEALQKAATLSPDIVLLAADLAGRDGYDTAERLAVSGLPLASILLSAGGDQTDALRRAMRAGARECLTSPLDAADLRESVRQVCENHRRRHTPEFAVETPAKIIAVTGAKGGVGKTTLAVNLAAALAIQTGEPTALLDLYTQFGDTALMLNLTPRRTLADLVSRTPADMDERLLEDHLDRHECGLHLLAGAATPLMLDALSPVMLDCILSLIKRRYRTVVLDVPPVLTETTRCALSHAPTVLLVANMFDLTTLADSRLWMDAMAGPHVSRAAIQIVLNRASPQNRLPLSEIERALGCPIFRQIPNDGRLVPASVNAGMPFVLSHPGSRVSQSVFEMARLLASADALHTSEGQGAAVPAPRRSRFLPSLLRRGGGA